MLDGEMEQKLKQGQPGNASEIECKKEEKWKKFRNDQIRIRPYQCDHVPAFKLGHIYTHHGGENYCLKESLRGRELQSHEALVSPEQGTLACRQV